ncbi:MAG: hypothetical protein QOD02_5569 [Mycobacterium sp.]|nr:hypothetical protein [Mycobacterium sp.]
MSVMFSIEMSCLCHFFPNISNSCPSVGAAERDAPAISVRYAAAAVALYAIASRDRCRLTGEWLRNAYADFMDTSGYPRFCFRCNAFRCPQTGYLSIRQLSCGI